MMETFEAKEENHLKMVCFFLNHTTSLTVQVLTTDGTALGEYGLL